jgi:hypothetical protein
MVVQDHPSCQLRTGYDWLRQWNFDRAAPQPFTVSGLVLCRCVFCDRFVSVDAEYWFFNGSLVCRDCFGNGGRS